MMIMAFSSILKPIAEQTDRVWISGDVLTMLGREIHFP
jgi:hypothetical protein